MNPTRLLLLLGLLIGASAPPALAAPTADEQRLRELGHGYAMLFEGLSQFRHLDLVLWLKREHDSVGERIEELADTSDTHRTRLAELAGQAPEIDLQDQGLTRFELAKRESLILDRGLQLGTPLLGDTGPAMERQALLSLAAAINQQRHLIQVMRPEERIAERRQWLDRLKQDLDALHTSYYELLEQRYFRNPPVE